MPFPTKQNGLLVEYFELTGKWMDQFRMDQGYILLLSGSAVWYLFQKALKFGNLAMKSDLVQLV